MKLLISTLLFFFHLVLFAQVDSPAEHFLNNSEKNIHRNRIKNWKEIPSRRTLYSSSYLKEDGTTVDYFSKEAVNFPDPATGKLIPVSTIPVSTADGWNASQQNIPFMVNLKGEILSEGFVFGSLKKFSTFPVDIDNLNYSSELIGDTLTLSQFVPGVDKIFHFRNNGLKYNYRINSALSLSGDLVFKEVIKFPSEGFSISVAEDSYSFVPEGSIIIKNEKGERKFSIAPVWSYDAAGHYVVSHYQIRQLNNLEYEITVVIPESFFTQSNLTYPVIIDPLITGPTSTWTGGIMPSCFSPLYNVDSMLVTCPGQVTVSNLRVISNFYANPFTTTVKADGAMFFSTSCNSTGNYTVPFASGGNLPGTAYADFDMHAPLMCCYPQNCNAYDFYLKMHLTRTSNGPGCNTTYLYYDPTSAWPFSAYIEGNTVDSYGSEATVLNPVLCSNECEFQIKTFTRYGVPPFILSHPWLPVPDTAGTPAGCSSSFTIQTVTLINPNCPTFCDTTSTLNIPPPVVTDACGNVVSNYPPLSLTLKPTPSVNAVLTDSVFICSGQPGIIDMEACLPGSVISWYGNSISGTGGVILDSNTLNSSNNLSYYNYEAYAELNGCVGDTSNYVLVSEPFPVADFTSSPSTIFINDLITTDDFISTPGNINSWVWTLDGNLVSSDTMANMIITNPGEYEVCLYVNSQTGCTDTICKNMTVLPLEIVQPNVFSPNDDNVNDYLEFTYLTFFENNNLKIFNRWGTLIFEKENYQNDWNGSGTCDGTYYYVLRVEDREYSGYFHLLR